MKKNEVHCKKNGYRSRTVAIKDMDRINNENGSEILKSVYKCKSCNSWHTTSMTLLEYANMSIRIAFYNNNTENPSIESINWRMRYLLEKQRKNKRKIRTLK